MRGKKRESKYGNKKSNKDIRIEKAKGIKGNKKNNAVSREIKHINKPKAVQRNSESNLQIVVRNMFLKKVDQIWQESSTR